MDPEAFRLPGPDIPERGASDTGLPLHPADSRATPEAGSRASPCSMRERCVPLADAHHGTVSDCPSEEAWLMRWAR